MKKIGLIGGITPESTIMYYQVLNNLASNYYGDKHTAKVVVNSLDFGEVSELQAKERWDLLDEMMSSAAIALEKAGAKSIVICANTMHLCIAAVRNSVKVPVVHIAEATAEAIVKKELKKVLLLGTKYTMEKTFYKDILKSHGIDVVVPNEADRNTIHNIIYKELAQGIMNETSKKKYLEVIKKSYKEGVEGVVLGCTEIPLLIQQEDVFVPVFDTTTIHATKAFNTSLK